MSHFSLTSDCVPPASLVHPSMRSQLIGRTKIIFSSGSIVVSLITTVLACDTKALALLDVRFLPGRTQLERISSSTQTERYSQGEVGVRCDIEYNDDFIAQNIQVIPLVDESR